MNSHQRYQQTETMFHAWGVSMMKVSTFDSKYHFKIRCLVENQWNLAKPINAMSKYLIHIITQDHLKLSTLSLEDQSHHFLCKYRIKSRIELSN